MNGSVFGRVVAKPELKTYGDKQFAAFSLAEDIGFGDKKTTQYYECTFWGKGAENLLKFLDKGTQVYLVGTGKSKGYMGKDGQVKSSIVFTVTDWKPVFQKKDGGQVDDGFKDLDIKDIPF